VSTKPKIFRADFSTSDLFATAHHVVTEINSLSEPITEEQTIERGLLLTKPEPSDQDIARALMSVGNRRIFPDALVEQNLLRDPSALVKWWTNRESDRLGFRSRINELMQSPNHSRTKHFAADLKFLRHKLLITCELDAQGKTINRVFPMTIEAAYRYVLVLLYRQEKKRWKRLRKCGYCQTFFLRKVSEVGGRPRDYCTPECQKKADQKKALVRQRNRRRRAKQSKRKRK